MLAQLMFSDVFCGNWPNQRFQSCNCDQLWMFCKSPAARSPKHLSRATRQKKTLPDADAAFLTSPVARNGKRGHFFVLMLNKCFFLLAQIGTGRFWSRFTVASFWCFGARTWPHLANHLPWEAGHPRRSWRTRLAGFCCMLWYCTAFLTLSLSHIKPIFRTQFGCPFFCLVFCFLVVFILHSRHVRQSDRKCTTYLASRSLASQRAATCTWAKRLYHTRPTTPREKQQQQNLVQWWCQMTKQRIYVILSYLCHQL